MTSPTNEPKTAEQLARGLCKQIELVPFCDCNSEVREDDPTCDYCYIKQALKLYAQQEGRELVEVIELYRQLYGCIGGHHSDKGFPKCPTCEAISTWKARNQ